jgi:hypothetical protein
VKSLHAYKRMDHWCHWLGNPAHSFIFLSTAQIAGDVISVDLVPKISCPSPGGLCYAL